MVSTSHLRAYKAGQAEQRPRLRGRAQYFGVPRSASTPASSAPTSDGTWLLTSAPQVKRRVHMTTGGLLLGRHSETTPPCRVRPPLISWHRRLA
jgi:hypothetical protein